MNTLAIEFLESYRFKFFWPSARSIHFNSCAYELLKPKNFSKCRDISDHHWTWSKMVLDHVKSFFRVLVDWKISLESISATAFSALLSGCSGQAKGDTHVPSFEDCKTAWTTWKHMYRKTASVQPMYYPDDQRISKWFYSKACVYVVYIAFNIMYVLIMYIYNIYTVHLYTQNMIHRPKMM